MKKEIHPEYYKDAKITCACGHVFNVSSTQKDMKVEVCSACHPFFTGTEKVMDTAGRVEKFKSRVQAATNQEGDKREKGSKQEREENQKTEDKDKED